MYATERLSHLAPRSAQTEMERMKPLKAYFGATSLSRLSADAIRQYVAHRKSARLSNRTINMEVGCLSRILKRGKRWHLLAEEIKPLPERHDIGRALTPAQKENLLKTASSKPEWQIAYLATTIALNTTMRVCEIRGLKWRDIDFIDSVIEVRKSKTQAGARLIPLNNDALGAILSLRRNVKRLFGDLPSPDWYIFPHAEGNSEPDPTRPMSSWRTAWRSLTRKAGLAGFRFHDLRHHAITELAESSTSEQTIMRIAGHVSARMLAHYSHVRLQAKRVAVLALCNTEGRSVTSQSTSQSRVSSQDENPKSLKNLVDVTGIEPATPCLQSRCSPS